MESWSSTKWCRRSIKRPAADGTADDLNRARLPFARSSLGPRSSAGSSRDFEQTELFVSDPSRFNRLELREPQQPRGGYIHDEALQGKGEKS
jgi:hypothetical protein